MEHYLGHTDYPIWEFIQKGNGPIQVSTDTNGQIQVLPPKTAEEILARERERKARTTLLMAIPEDHLEKFYKMTDDKEMWEAIKSRFSGNDESKKMHKYILKQQFEGFFVSNLEGLHKGYDRFQSILSQLETHGAGVSTEDANQKFLSGPQLDHEDLEQVDEFNLEEMDLKWQMAMISTRLKKFYKKTGKKLHFDAKEPVGFDKSKVDNSSSDTEVTSCSKVCEESYAKLKKLYDEQMEQLGVSSIEIQAYTLALKKVEAQLVCRQKNQLAYEEDISQMSAKDKSGLGYGSQIHDEVLSYENEVFAIVFDSRSIDVEDSPVNDRFAKVEGMHAVPPPKTGNYMPLKYDFGIDESKFTYGPKQSTTSESDAKTSDLDSCNSSSSEETLETVPKLVESKPKVINEPKVWSAAPIIEEYESDSDDEYVSKASVKQEKPSCAFINIVKHVKTPRQTAKEQNTCSQNSKPSKRDWNGLMFKKLGLGYVYTKKACFVCCSFSHLIRDCDFHEKRMAKQVELNKQKVNADRQKFSSQATSTSTTRKVNTA
nr:ribonuclease H-like domain-containing protein [Tanacetum cinerariifolium]